MGSSLFVSVEFWPTLFHLQLHRIHKQCRIININARGKGLETSSFWFADTSRHYVVGMLCLIRRQTCRYAHKLFAWLSTKFHHLYYTFPPECLASFVNSRIAKHYYVLSHNTKFLHLAWKVLYSFILLKHAVVCVLCVSTPALLLVLLPLPLQHKLNCICLSL